VPYVFAFGDGELRVTACIADEGVALLDKIIGKLAVRKRNQMPHPCVGGGDRSGAAMGVLCIAGAAPITAKPFKGPTYSAPLR